MMINIKKINPNSHNLVWILLAVLLGGCQTVKPGQTQMIENQSLQQRQAALSALQHWQVKGKFIFKSPQEKFSVSLNWNQQAERSDIRLTTFMGISMVKMVNDKHLATLEADGQTYKSTDPQSLLLQTTGITLPVNNMTQWMKGATGDADNQELTLDQYHRITRINLLDDHKRAWQIDYQNYLQVQSYQLPQRVKLSGNGITITIKISDWEIISD
jgi:outer membrane lipoprotein LolB